MTDQTGAAPAAAEPIAAPVVPINEAPVTAPNPVDSSGPEKAPEAVIETKPSSSVKEAIERAEAKLKEAPKDTKAIEAKPVEAKAEPKPRDDTGKFAPKTPQETQAAPPVEQKQAPVTEQPAKPTQFSEAPKRFSDDAKTHWATAPEPVRAEIHRAVKELETGLNQYKEVVEPLRPYLQLAQQNGTTVDKALEQYIGLERKLTSQNMADKQAGIEHVFQYAGINPRDWAANILNQSPDQVQSQNDATIRELNQKIAQLEQKVGGVTTTIQQQREQSTLQEINNFASAPEHSRFEELADDIAFFMKSGRTNDLSEAYKLAERLNPAPLQSLAASTQAPVIPAIPPADAHTKGTKSISGTPSPGSSPAAKRGPSPSIRDALKSAMAKAS